MRSPAFTKPTSLLGTTLPGTCAICRRWTRGRLCAPCVRRFAPDRPRCLGCAIGLQVEAPRCGACVTRADRSVSRTVAALDYSFPWDGLITAFKFHRQLDLGQSLARLLMDAVRRAEAHGDAPDLILPVPLHAHRLRERGYNQAWELARRVARWRGIEANPRALSRIRNTAHQLGLNEQDRVVNLRNAFLVEPGLEVSMRGRRIALVDDVSTSGATGREAARVLREAGAADVCVWVVARTPAPGER